MRAKLITAILSPVLFFGVLEAALRIAGYRYAPDVSVGSEKAQWLQPALYERDPVLRWRLTPNAVLHEPRRGFTHVSTNGLGLRGSQPPGDRRPREFRVLCLGDSVTFGLGVLDGQTYPEQLERALLASPELAGRPVHVLNGGVPGWSSVQSMRLLDRVRWYEPDVIVFWSGFNDVQAALGRPDAETGRLVEVISVLSDLRTVQLVANAVDAMRGARDGATRASIEDFSAALERLKTLEAGGGPRVVFVRYQVQLDTTIAQLSRVFARAEAVGVEWVTGPGALLLPITPAPDGADLVGRVVRGPNGPELRFCDSAEFRNHVGTVRDDLEDARRWRRDLAARCALLPGDSIGAEELFGGARPAAVFTDNCHLTAEGCWRAAQGIAARILSRLRR
jgi:lysophospholipase L1-like esterase